MVVTTAMMDALSPSEREVLLAHEQSHIDHHHHRFTLISGVASLAVPSLRLLARHVRFATERWADEVTCRAARSSR